MKITLKGVNNMPLNEDALNYISNLLSTCEPMIIVSIEIKMFSNLS